ncbi:MAG: L,D-transpeptidase [Hyphomicrobiales bacterium]|jgi:lipoprotein-anchoring transpeptidase ErfK/SrfK|nr:L,D-transpeptidase [Hyphomicrobiales bacterium]
MMFSRVPALSFSVARVARAAFAACGLATLALAPAGTALAQGLPPGAYADPRGAYLDRPLGVPVQRGGYDYEMDPYAAPDDGYAPQRAYPSSTRRMVSAPMRQPKGTVVVDTRSRNLYLMMGDGRAMAYGIGVGRQGFSWKGQARVGRKAQWPGWTPPAAMLKRRPDLPRHMAGGIDNPLGARALYLYQGKKDTLYRIHGTNEPWTIGQAVSSGCIRMLNNDVVDLFTRVPVGAKVVVL